MFTNPIKQIRSAYSMKSLRIFLLKKIVLIIDLKLNEEKIKNS